MKRAGAAAGFAVLAVVSAVLLFAGAAILDRPEAGPSLAVQPTPAPLATECPPALADATSVEQLNRCGASRATEVAQNSERLLASVGTSLGRAGLSPPATPPPP